MSPTPRLLIVDDDLEFLEILAGRFRRRGFAVIERSTCSDALLAAEHESFDVAVVDRTLPGDKDLEVLERLIALRRDLPVVVLSGWNSRQHIEQALAAGACDYLTKPCALADIETAVRRALDCRAATPPVSE
jgi:ActR/RegA family two-component response regulator